MKTEKTPLPWHVSNGAIYAANGARVLLADRTTMSTLPTERDSNISYASHAANLYPELVQWLATILDQVDYTTGACRLNEMVGAVLPEEIIQQAKAVLAKCKEE